MSADNWAECPRCLKTESESLDRARLAAGESYGKVPPGVYLASLRAVEAKAGLLENMESTLREDYELGITREGQFCVIYKARCSRCGFAHTFKHEQMLEVQQADHAGA